MSKTNNGANLGFENQLWSAADKLRGHMDASEYKHVVLGLIFLKYISDAFQAKYKQLEATKDTEYTDPEDRDEYSAGNIFWVPKEARWAKLQASAKQPTIGKLVDDAMVAIEKENPKLKGVLPKDYARPSLDKHRLGASSSISSARSDSGTMNPAQRTFSAGCTTHVVGQAACLSRANVLLRNAAVGWATSQSTVRNPTPQPGDWP